MPFEGSEKDLDKYIQSIQSKSPELLQETAKALLEGVDIMSLVDKDSNVSEQMQKIAENSLNLTQDQKTAASTPQFEKCLNNYIKRAYLESKDKETEEEESKDDIAPTPNPSPENPTVEESKTNSNFR